jgi:hypothetical protein
MIRIRWIALAVQWVIVAAILVGGALAIRSGQKHSGLRAEYRRLATAVGELNVEDPEKIWIVALDTGDPMHFAWRVYLPANFKLQVNHSSGSFSSSYSDPMEFIARVRFRGDDDDAIHVYKQFGSGSSLMRYAHNESARFVRDHWEQLQVEQLGADGMVAVDREEAVDLFRIRLPDTLREQAQAELPKHSVARLSYHVTLNPKDSPP